MRQLSVAKNCNACGRCFLLTDLLIEDDYGKALPAKDKFIEQNDENAVSEAIKSCPVGAISIVEKGVAKNTGKKGLEEILENLKSKLKAFKVPEVSCSDINFNAKNYDFPIPSARGEYDYVYSSDSRAERAGLDEFDRIMYSQYRAIIKNILVQYKNHKLRPYYLCEENSESYYFNVNIKIEEMLKEAKAEALYLCEGTNFSLPKDFDSFKYYPKDADYICSVERLSKFDERSTSLGIMDYFKNEKSYSSLSDYASYLDTDAYEKYEGESLFGQSKYKTCFCYKNIYEACNEYLDDLKFSMNMVDIDEDAFNELERAINQYKEIVDKELNNKIKQFSEAIRVLS